jgi:hypothetical protein
LAIYGTAEARAPIRIALLPTYKTGKWNTGCQLNRPSVKPQKMILSRNFLWHREFRMKRSYDSFEKRKVPRPYERAEDGARSLNGRRDDELWEWEIDG